MDILDAIRPCLKELAEHTGETVHFVRLDGDMAIYIAKESSYRNSVRMVSRVGSRIPLYCSGVGKALLSSMTPEEICHYWQHAEIRKFTENTITSPDVMEQALQQIKQTQYALDDEEHEPGVRCIAVSIHGTIKRPDMPSAFLPLSTVCRINGSTSSRPFSATQRKNSLTFISFPLMPEQKVTKDRLDTHSVSISQSVLFITLYPSSQPHFRSLFLYSI